MLLWATALFQTAHSYTHMVEEIGVPECHHKQYAHQKQITHAHHYAKDCSVCFYSVSHFLAPSATFFETANVNWVTKKTTIYTDSSFHDTTPNWFSLRAPPVAA